MAKEPTKWRPVSYIREYDYEKLDSEARRSEAIDNIEKLRKENEAYFAGMELEFNNRASFIQSICDPRLNSKDEFITV